MLRMQVLLERKKEARGIKGNVEQCTWAETHETCDRESDLIKSNDGMP